MFVPSGTTSATWGKKKQPSAYPPGILTQVRCVYLFIYLSVFLHLRCHGQFKYEIKWMFVEGRRETKIAPNTYGLNAEIGFHCALYCMIVFV